MARSEICKYCCPTGGALFDVVISAAALNSDDPTRGLTGADYVKKCRNCGTEKPLVFRRSAKRTAYQRN